MNGSVTQHPQRHAFLANQRWFAGKGREFEITDVRTVARLGERVRIELVEVEYAEGAPTRETYQMPVSAYPEPQERLSHALVREGDGEWTYDAVHDRDAMALYLQAFDQEAELGAVRFERLPGHDLDLSTHSSLFGGEQSNSSIAFGEDSLLKIFRRITVGTNPDVEIHRALTEAGSTHVAALYGFLSVPGEDLHLAILQQFLRTASDGWELALASARNLFTALEEPPGGDFAAEAHRLGATLASVHETLAAGFGTGTVESGFVADQMRSRLDAATATVPELDRLGSAPREAFARLAELDVVEVQRVHGDLHLGQTLRTSLGWKLVDFEGEPAKELAERRLPDSCWRDVAGMIRSFDYAASTVARDLGDNGGEVPVAERATAWTAHNTEAFLAGYTEERGRALSSADQVLLNAYVLDKLVYEAVYETRNRPGWRGIPLAALARAQEGAR